MAARILARRLTRDLHCKQFTRTLVKIANRPKLPGSRGTGFPEFLKGHRENCPHKILAQDYGINENTSPEHCAKAISDSYKKLLYEHGLLLLQGFPLGDAAKFNTFLDNLDGLVQMLSKESAFRHAVDKKIYLASDYTNEATIEPHNEMSVAPKYPHVVLFACKQPGVGGESVLVDCASWFEQVNRTVRDEFAQKGGIKYRCYLMENAEAYNGKQLGADVSWKNFFLTDSKAEVESQLKANNREFFWHENNALEYWFTKPISINHHKTGTTLWFNQTNIHHPTWYTEMYPETWGKSGIPFDKFPFQVYYGDGSQIKDEVIQHIRNVAWTVAVGFQMQKNEVIIIDNERLAHARLDFKGDRKLFAAFLQDSDRLLDTSKMDSTIS